MSDFKQTSGRSASLLQTLRAVAWSFLGIRRASGLEDDVQKLSPVHVVMADEPASSAAKVRRPKKGMHKMRMPRAWSSRTVCSGTMLVC